MYELFTYELKISLSLQVGGGGIVRDPVVHQEVCIGLFGFYLIFRMQAIYV